VAQASGAVARITSQLAKEFPATNELKTGIVAAYDPLGVEDRPQFLRLQTMALILTGATNTYTGTTAVNSGTLLLNTTHTGGDAYTLNGGTLGGSGSTTSSITVNAGGTLNLLQAMRESRPESPFIFMSTNKVYGDAPNEIPLVELETRYDYAQPADHHGVDERCRLDQSLHSLFGASKAAADLVAQEYGRYYGMPVGILRAGCMTGPSHSGVELHGFLSYLVKVVVVGEPYTIYGYKGKQVRDQIHCHYVINAFWHFAQNPRPGEVYNLGGGRWGTWAVVSANTAGMSAKDAIRTKAAAATIERRWHPFRNVKGAVYRARPLLTADLTKGLD
jgi:autotransporter-associated beta strand protein